MLKKFVAIVATLALSVVPATTTYATDVYEQPEPNEVENGETYPEYSQNIPISPHNTTTLNPRNGILNSMHGGGWSVGYRAVDQFGRLGFVTCGLLILLAFC